MAKAKLEIPFSGMSGKLSGNSEFYLTHRYGKIVVSNYPKHRDPKNITPHQRELNSAFSQAVQQCKVEMSDPNRLAYWQDRYVAYRKAANKSLARANTQFFDLPADAPTSAKEKYYSTLRGFIIAQLRKN